MLFAFVIPLVATDPTVPEIGAFVSMIAWCLAVVGAGLGIAVAVKKLRERQPGAMTLPQPLQVQLAERFANKDDLAPLRAETARIEGESRSRAAANAERILKLETDFRNQIVELRGYIHNATHAQTEVLNAMRVEIKDSAENEFDAIKAVDRSSEARTSKLHGRIDTLVEVTGGLKASAQHASTELGSMRQTLNILLSRTAPAGRRGGSEE